MNTLDLLSPFENEHLPLVDADLDSVDMGMRVEAVWAPKETWSTTFENIRYFRPIDEPDVPFDDFKEHL